MREKGERGKEEEREGERCKGERGEALCMHFICTVHV